MSPSDKPFLDQVAASCCRFLHFGVAWSDLRRARATGDWSGWSHTLATRAAAYAQAAADADDSPVTAGELWRRAAIAYHYAAIRLPRGAAKERFRRSVRRCFERAAPRLRPPAERVVARLTGGQRAVGYYRSAGPRTPCVLLVNGLDSAKEVELATFAEGFLARGCSTFAFDAPGQGERTGGGATLADFPAAVSGILDFLARRVPDTPAWGIFGVSFGGHLACRAFALEPRLAIAVCLGGFHDGEILGKLPPAAWENLRQAYGDPPAGDTELAARITLAGTPAALDRPLLVVHGTADHLVDEAQVERLRRWSPGCETWILEGAEHVCTDRFGELLPRIGDWLARGLQMPLEVAGGAS